MKAKIKELLIKAMKGHDITARDTFRYINSEIAKKEKDLKRDLTDDEIIGIIKKEIKANEELIKIVNSNNIANTFIVDEANIKIKLLNDLLPTQLSEEEVRQKITELFNEYNFENMGQAMKVVIPALGAIADKGLISKIVKEML